MTKITFEIDDLNLQEARSDVSRAFLEEVAEDIYKGDAGWWAEQICQPLLTTIKEELSKPDNKLLKKIFNELVTDYLDEVSVEDIVREIIEERIKDKIDSLLTAFISNIK